MKRPDGAVEKIGCAVLVLACNGYGGDPALVRRHIPEMADALYFGHAGNRGDALRWGEALGGVARDLGAYQGHGSVAHPHGILITWALIMEGGFQLNMEGRRFSDETPGIFGTRPWMCCASLGVLPIDVCFDARLHALGIGFEDYRAALDAGAVRSADSIEGLALLFGIPAQAAGATLAGVREMAAGVRMARIRSGAILRACGHWRRRFTGCG